MFTQISEDLTKGQKLLDLCQAFIQQQDITCGEAVYQTDRVIENAYEFIESICEIVGYKEFKDE